MSFTLATKRLRPLLFVTEQRVGGDEDLPLGVPDAAADQSRVGELGGDQAL